MSRARLVLADDHPIVLEGLEQLFRLEPDFEVVARCRDGDETLTAVRAERPDLLILDIKMPRRDGLAVLRAIREEGLPTRVVLLTAALDDEQLVEAVRLGVRGLVLKETAPRLLISAMREVRAGGQWLEAGPVSRALRKLVAAEQGRRGAEKLLTAREIEIVRMAGRACATARSPSASTSPRGRSRSTSTTSTRSSRSAAAWSWPSTRGTAGWSEAPGAGGSGQGLTRHPSLQRPGPQPCPAGGKRGCGKAAQILRG